MRSLEEILRPDDVGAPNFDVDVHRFDNGGHGEDRIRLGEALRLLESPKAPQEDARRSF